MITEEIRSTTNKNQEEKGSKKKADREGWWIARQEIEAKIKRAKHRNIKRKEKGRYTGREQKGKSTKVNTKRRNKTSTRWLFSNKGGKRKEVKKIINEIEIKGTQRRARERMKS